jgi:ribosomal protein L7/L12
MVGKVELGNGEEGAKTRRFALRDADGSENSIFTGRSPRQAALKAANKSNGTEGSPVTLKLREHGTKKLHVFKAWKAIVDAPENRPKWLPEKINRAFVEKVKIEPIGK